MPYRLLVLDLDGTLTNAEKRITPRTLSALIAAQDSGVRLVLASGRPTYGIVPLAEELQMERYGGYILSYNGGVILDWSNRQTLFEQILDPATVPQLYASAQAAGMEILTYQGEVIATTNAEDEYACHEAFINKMPLVQYDEFLQQIVYPLHKCLIVGAPAPLRQLELRLAREMEGSVSVYRSADFFLECVPVGIDKARSIERLASSLGIRREEIIACGDGHNDLSMIAYAGLGVAMANAVGDVKTAADFITLSNEEDGIAYVIEKYILG